MYFRCLLIFSLLAGSPLLAQEKAAGVSRNEEAMSSFQAVNASIDTILQEYEQLTGSDRDNPEFSENRVPQCSPTGAFVHDPGCSSRYKGNPVPEFQEFC